MNNERLLPLLARSLTAGAEMEEEIDRALKEAPPGDARDFLEKIAEARAGSFAHYLVFEDAREFILECPNCGSFGGSSAAPISGVNRIACEQGHGPLGPMDPPAGQEDAGILTWAAWKGEFMDRFA